ncbi:MAG: hypothetical protein H0V46_03120 [Sphingomonas sp.]|nr:hypothetical protein [Sphingomonas sp.]
MKMLLPLALLTSSFLAGGVVWGQVVDRVWENGTVTHVGFVALKPGKLNAYMKYLKDVTLPRIEDGKRRGEIVSYRILRVNSPREDEPHILVLTEFKNMAVFDRDPAITEEVNRKLAGSPEGRRDQLVQVRDLIEPKGSMLTREVVLTR